MKKILNRLVKLGACARPPTPSQQAGLVVAA
jgi:hypothetical protein